ncbi:transposase [Neisseriaceae bacterium B1]
MSSFFYQSAQTLLNQYADRFPLLKITQLLDWQAIEQTLASHKVRYVRDNGGRPAYPLLLMFRAVLLGQWHSLSAPEEEGFIEQIHVTPANASNVNHLETVLDKVEHGVKVYADKGYDSQFNREFLEKNQLVDGIMRKAHRNKSLTREDIGRNKELAKIRYRVEQSFAILHRIFRCKRASYFGLERVKGQLGLKVICLNLLKAANKLRLVAPIAA